MKYLAVFLFISMCYTYSYGEVKNECHKRHEVSKCLFDCPPETTCRTRGIKYRCYRTDDMKCQDKCVCEENYYRNEIGECVTSEQCDQCSGENEYYACGSACDNVCATLSTQNRTNCPIINIKCNEKCYCVDGTARNEDNACVPIANCQRTSLMYKYHIRNIVDNDVY